jgi:peptidyl-prolyl cis-trans isomerase B (cyclophilin B)
MKTRLLAVPAILLLCTGLAGCGNKTESAASPPAQTPTPIVGAKDCTYPAAGPAAKKADLPPTKPLGLDAVTVKTNRGDIVVALESAAAPCTVNSFVSLALQGYFDNTKCHRLVPGFVLQCGDPSATGRGGPGYSFADELTGKETYPAGTFAMANSGPDTNGSQFFIVLDDANLPASYTVFGKVDPAGLKVAKDIEAGGNGADGIAPAKEVVIESVS